MDKVYIHPTSHQEGQRLIDQALLLEPSVYRGIDMRGVRSLVEIGCGVGAQTSIMLRRYPLLKIHAVDRSQEQVDQALRFLKPHVGKRVEVQKADALSLPYEDGVFDAAFSCWFLEHAPDQVAALREMRRVLRDGGVVYCNEPVNSMFHLEPYCPATLEYRAAFTDFHWTHGGDPFVGIKLGNLLAASGFAEIEVWPVSHLYDDRSPEGRAKYVDYWLDLLLSSAAPLLAAGKVTQATIDAMEKELTDARTKPGTVIMDTWMQARAHAVATS